MFRLTAITLCIALPLAATAQNYVPGAHFVENFDQDGDAQVTFAEATEKRGDIFYMFDADENGQMDAEEYAMFDETRLEDMQQNAGGYRNGAMRGVNQGMMRQYNDVNGDGVVSEQEFMARAADWFAMMDRNGDSVITTADFRRGRG